MRIVIAGDDEVALRLAEALMEDHEVFLICPDPGDPRIGRLEVEPVQGRPTSSEILRQARTHKAGLFIACSSQDEINLVSCVAARRLGAGETACFLFSRDIQTSADDQAALAEALGIDHVIRPAEQLAEEILRIITVPDALDVESFEGGRVRLVRHKVQENSRLTTGTLREIGTPRGVVLVMGRRGDQVFLPRGDTRFLAGDVITAMGGLIPLNRFRYRALRDRSRGAAPRRATVVGGGVVGSQVALGLQQSGWDVKVIEADRRRCEEISAILDCLVLHGDGADLDLLRMESVDEDSVLVAVTSNDERNLLVSLLAKRQLGIQRIITRADQPVNERLFEKVGIDVVRSARGAAIQAVVHGVVRSHEGLVAEVEHGDAVVLRIHVPEGYPRTRVSDLEPPGYAIIGSILRGRKVIIPHGGNSIQGGDRLLVFALRPDEEAVRRYFEASPEG